MKERKKKYVALWQVMQRECRRLVSRPLYLFCMVIAPLFCYLFFTTLMDSGLPQNLPAGVVDMDDSSTSRNIVRNLDAFSQTGVVAHYSNVTDARIAVQEGKIYGFFYIPKGLSAEAQSQRQPKISFYTNYSYLIAGSLLFRDMKMMGELTAGSAARSVLYAKGATEDQAMGFLQPIVIDTPKPFYDFYSFRFMPWLGSKIAGDADSYRYLAESIRMHPAQAPFAKMMEEAGFTEVTWHNLTFGICALHVGTKPDL